MLNGFAQDMNVVTVAQNAAIRLTVQEVNGSQNTNFIMLELLER